MSVKLDLTKIDSGSQTEGRKSLTKRKAATEAAAADFRPIPGVGARALALTTSLQR